MSTKAQQEWYQLNRERIARVRAARYVATRIFRKCDICGSDFVAAGKTNKTLRCSIECKKVGRKRSIKKYLSTDKAQKWLHQYQNRKDRKEYLVKYRKEHLQEKRAWENAYKASHPEVRLYQILRATLNNRIGLENAGTSQYVDYTCKQLREHLEKQFKPGMNWENHSINGWHIDHKKSLSEFKFFGNDGAVRTKEVRKAMSLTNLQPLWAKENISKGGINRFGRPTVSAGRN